MSSSKKTRVFHGYRVQRANGMLEWMVVVHSSICASSYISIEDAAKKLREGLGWTAAEVVVHAGIVQIDDIAKQLGWKG